MPHAWPNSCWSLEFQGHGCYRDETAWFLYQHLGRDPVKGGVRETQRGFAWAVGRVVTGGWAGGCEAVTREEESLVSLGSKMKTT